MGLNFSLFRRFSLGRDDPGLTPGELRAHHRFTCDLADEILRSSNARCKEKALADGQPLKLAVDSDARSFKERYADAIRQ